MAQAPAHVVVINDDDGFLEVMRLALTDEGYHVETRKEWDDAHAFVRARQPDLVILDIVLGHAEAGWGILAGFQGDPDTSEIPVIVCSASPGLDVARPELAAENVRTIAKPFDLDEVLALVRTGLRLRRDS